MIVLHSVSKELGRGSLRKLVLKDITWSIPPRTRIMLLGQKGSGKTTLLQIISGARFPTSGWVERRASICNIGRLLPRRGANFTPRQIAIRLSHLYRFPSEEVVQFVERFGELEGQMDRQLKSLPRDVHQRLPYALGYAIPFDFYLFDGSVGGRRGPFRERCQAAFETRCRQTGVIFATSSPKIAAQFDGIAGILHDGRVHVFPTVQAALSVFESLPPPETNRKMAAEEDEDYGDEEEQEWI